MTTPFPPVPPDATEAALDDGYQEAILAMAENATDRSVVEALWNLAVAERTGTAQIVPVLLGPYSAYTLIAAIQLAWRHPSMTGTQREMLEDIARPMQDWFGGVLAESLEAGWDVSQDRDPGEVAR